MEIKELKRRLLMPMVLSHYGEELQKNNRICCPFHDDKTPSMHYFPKTETVQCFSSNCQHSGKPLDVISFIQIKEHCTTHEAIMQGKRMLGEEVPRDRPIDKVWRGLHEGLKKSSKAQAYLKERCLTMKDVGYYSGKWGRSKLVKEAREVGLITGAGKSWAANCLIFPLRNAAGRVVSFYGRSLSKGHYYQTGRHGLYPSSPNRKAKKVILTESVIDAATLLEMPKIKEEYEVLALYGTQGFTKEHELALKACEELEEVIIMLDGDKPGRLASEQHKQTLSKLLPKVKVRVAELPDKLDVNEIWVNHLNEEIIVDLLQEVVPAPSVHLDTSDPSNLHYKGVHAEYYIKGLKLGKGLESMKVTLITSVPHPRKPMKARGKVELYEDVAVEKYCSRASRKVGVSAELLEVDINLLVEELEKYRERDLAPSKGIKESLESIVGKRARSGAEAFLEGPDLFKRLNDLIGQSGIVGEEETRLMLLIIASSYKCKRPLHGLIQGSSGTGKTLLLHKIMDFIPEHSRHVWTRITDKALYYSGEKLQHTSTALEDWDGISEEAQYALREMQTSDRLKTETTYKDEEGNMTTKDVVAYGPISSLICTTHGQIYEDNMSRCFTVAIDESAEQTERIIEYQNAKMRGEIDHEAEAQATQEIQSMVAVLQPLEVVNPYAGRVNLPKEVHKLRRLNNLYLVFVQQIAWWHQRQRNRDKLGRIVAEKEDLRLACELLFETIVLKVDELDGSLRQFYEQLKTYVQTKGAEYEFTRLEIRQALKISKTRQHRYWQELLSLEYLDKIGGYVNKGYTYRIAHWDDNKAVRKRLLKDMENQLNHLK